LTIIERPPDTPVHVLEGGLDCRRRRSAKRTGAALSNSRRRRYEATDLMSKRLMPCLLLLLTWCSPAYSGDLIGQAGIIDGDTLEIHGTRIRLWGVDAPESAQLCRGEDSLQYRCGAQAANNLDAFYRKTAGELHAHRAGSLRADGGDMLG
jgi:endonuclease YncB( thermonuclease family)